MVDLLDGWGVRVRKRDVQNLVVEAVDTMTKLINDCEVGIRSDEGILDFLSRAAQFFDLSKSIPDDVW